MRLAEFKMRLLVFFAGALRKWAGSIEPAMDGRARREGPVDDGAVWPAEFRREAGAASGPPEHWTRLVRSGPPDHWLDLIREKAPHLLPANEDESVSRAGDGIPLDGPRGELFGGPFDGVSEAQLDRETGAVLSRESGTEERTAAKLRSRRRSERTDGSSARVSGAKWLRRLRFQSPRQRADIEKPTYPINEATKGSEYGAASRDSGSTAERHQSPVISAAGYDQRREPATDRRQDRRTTSPQSATRGLHSGDDVREVEDRCSRLESGAGNQSRRRSAVATGQESWTDQSDRQASSSSKAQPEEARPETTDSARSQHLSNIGPNTFVERGDANSASARSLLATNSPAETKSAKPPARSQELAREPARESPTLRGLRFAAARNYESSSSRASRQISADGPVTGSNRHPSHSEPEPTMDHETRHGKRQRAVAESSRALEAATIANARVLAQSHAAEAVTKKPVINAARRDDEQARNRFASVDLGAPARVELSESMWPALPPSRNFETNFEIRDELAAMEREVESLRRLDREQRGTHWNA